MHAAHSLLLLIACGQDPALNQDTAGTSDASDGGAEDGGDQDGGGQDGGDQDGGADGGADTGGDGGADTGDPGPNWSLDPDKDDLLRSLFAALKPTLISYIDVNVAGGDPTWLYNVQLTTAPLLAAAIRLEDADYLSDLADIYMAAHPLLTLETDYLYYYWPGDDYLSAHPLDEPAQMWLDSNGQEIILESSQFLYGVSALANGIAQIPAEERTGSMTALIDGYASVLVTDHYARWVFATHGPFQLQGWGCAAGMLNHQEYIEGRMADGFCADDPDRYSYINAVTDTDLWIAAGVVEVIAAHQADPTAMPMDDALEARFIDYLADVASLTETRLDPTTLNDWEGGTTQGVGFDIDVWRDHPEFAYTGYEGTTFPTSGDAAVAQDCGWDVSHARRFVQVFDTFHAHPDLLDSARFDDTFMESLSNQLVYGAMAGNPEWPLLNNFMSGHNGWYRVNLDAGSGYAPYGLTRALMDGGYGAWHTYNPDIGTINDRLWELVQATWVVDGSGAGRSATQSGGGWTADGAVGGAATFAGDGYLDLGVDSSYATARGSVEMWFRTDGQNTEDDLLNIFENGYYDFLLVRRTSSDQILLYIEDDDAGVLSVYSTTTVQTDTWHHLVITQDGAGAHIYIDGVDTTATGNNSGAWTGHLSIAGAWLSKGHWYTHSGAVDEVRIYDRALPPEEVAEHYAGSFTDDTGLLAWWAFDEAVDTAAAGWLAEHYASSFSPTSSWELLQFLPVFTTESP